MGRTGAMFGIEHWRVRPDVMAIGKGIASGLPMGATMAPAEIMDWEAGSHANTFGGNPVACEAALATIELLEQKLVRNAGTVGAYLLEGLQTLQTQHRLIGDVRGKGLLIGIECVRDRTTKEMAIKERNNVIQRCFRKGLLLLGCGSNVIRMVPPLVISKHHADTALSILDEAFTAVENSR
jgi:4-aminobutyrate aminotransferase